MEAQLLVLQLIFIASALVPAEPLGDLAGGDFIHQSVENTLFIFADTTTLRQISECADSGLLLELLYSSAPFKARKDTLNRFSRYSTRRGDALWIAREIHSTGTGAVDSGRRSRL